jgi:hypothetical protein
MTKFSNGIRFLCLEHFYFEHSDLLRISDFVLRILIPQE